MAPARRPPAPTPADWSGFVPSRQRGRSLRWRGWQRLKTRLFTRSLAVATLLGGYLLICLFLLLWGSATVGLLAVLPLLLPPPVAYLAYWLLWREFHE